MITLTPQVQNIAFDPMKQLVPITNVGTGAQVMAIKRSLPATDLAEFLAYAKANPGKLNFSTAGVQNLSEFLPVRLFNITGVDLVKVPARAEPQAISDLMGGVTTCLFGNASSLLPLANNDQIRLIAVSAPKRLAGAPDLPTVAETVPGFNRIPGTAFWRQPDAGIHRHSDQDRGLGVRQKGRGCTALGKSGYCPGRNDRRPNQGDVPEGA